MDRPAFASERRPIIGFVFGAASFLLAVATSAAAYAANDLATSKSLLSAIRAVHLAEPLVATSPTTAREDEALAQTLASYQRRSAPDDVAALTAFLANYPRSGWGPALSLNLGLSYLHDGYFSKAIAAWHNAWVEGKDATEPHAKALVDRAVGELARLYASFGQLDALNTLFAEIGDRKVTGSATEAIQAAREVLSFPDRDKEHPFNCGPVALKLLMLSLGIHGKAVEDLQWYPSGRDGTNLAQVASLADQTKFPHRVVFRKPGQPVPVPSVVHWKLGHFATIVAEKNSRFQVEDPVFSGSEIWVTQGALDSEASGYFLAPETTQANADWRTVDATEASRVWGKGPPSGTEPGAPGPQDPNANPPCGKNCDCGGMCGYNIGESTVSLNLSDTPVGYAPPIGPSTKTTVTYNQREASQPAVFSFFNVSPKWTLNWISYVTDDPAHPGASVSRYIAGGGSYSYSGYQSATGRFTAQNNDGSVLALVSQTPIVYQRQLQDGSIEEYAQSDGSLTNPRNIFLTKIIDPQGNALTLNYDGQLRLTSLTDAVGRQTTFSYDLVADPLLVTKITDPFGRSATFTYDGSGRLSSITDVIGLTSSFTYDGNSLVNSMTTPYGTSTFAYTAPGGSGTTRFVQVTDPLGFNEREESLDPSSIPDSDPPATVPQGMPVPPTNSYLSYRNSFHWDKEAYVTAGCTPTGGCDYTKARIRHFDHVPNSTIKSTSIESVKYPLENRIWYSYTAQTQGNFAGTYEKPIATGRVLDDGSTQLSLSSYDTGGYFNLTQNTDPVRRTTSFAYANQVDIAAISQTGAFGVQQTIAQFLYNTRHRPVFYMDAAGQTTTYAYNAAGQLTSVTNPLNQITSFQYNGTADLTTIVNANSATTATFTYDSYDRIRTYTDSEGWTATYDYDDADRITKITYPDGTTDIYTYDELDLASYRDRLGRLWTYTHDANRRLTAISDPAGNQTILAYSKIGKLTGLTDAKSNTTSWSYDVQGRLTQKTYADTSTLTYTYENTTSRLASTLDALGQTKQYGYANDNRLTGITYLSPVNPTPNVTFSYDPHFPRLASMTDGNGTAQYSYVAVGSLGALKLQQESGPLPSSTIDYTYDELGRLASRSVAGAGMESFDYDAIGRLTTHGNDLGSFTLGYLGETTQIASRQLASSTLATTWGYLPNSGDRRLASVSNTGLAAGQFSNYTFTTTPENFITAIGETSDSAAAYPAASAQTASYNNLNQLTSLSGQPLTYDADGNLTSDGQRNYAWDAENRLIGITYPSEPGKQTAFSYDGQNRRTTISSTPPGGGTTTTTSYIWCGIDICQARDAGNSTAREYYPEGEFVPGSPGQPLYYGIDQIASVRRTFENPSTAPAYSYDAYGTALQGTTPVTDFGYAGMFYNIDSGLNLTQYRAYDPISGRWISRDPLSDHAVQVAPIVDRGPAQRSTGFPELFYKINWPFAYDFTMRGDAAYVAIQGVLLAEMSIIVTWPDDLNAYGYVAGNPLDLTDPTGEGPVGDFIRACGVALGIYMGGQAIGNQPPRFPVEPAPVVRITPPAGSKPK